jgi:hypothetical protein
MRSPINSCDNRRSATVAFFENLEEVVTRRSIERLKTPLRMSRCTPIAAVAAGEREVGEQLGHALDRLSPFVAER